MSSNQSKYAQMRSKLQGGLEKLKEISTDDNDGMGTALIKLHGAMEDFVRLEVAQKAPHLRETVEDLKQTNWNDLLDYGREYLNFSDNDCKIISNANFQRNKYAHGGDYTFSYSEIKNYAHFVENWCTNKVSVAVGDWVKDKPSPQPRRTYEPAPQPAYKPPPANKGQPIYTYSDKRPWYRSTLFLLFSFIFLSPIWAILMLTDRRQGCLVKTFALSLLGFQCFICNLGYIPYLGSVSTAMESLLPQLYTQPIATKISPETESTLRVPNGTNEIDTTCIIVWEEYPFDDLANKNRSMVWEEIVLTEVEGSGMTASQFYDLVVEKNPHLAVDGYEFKGDKKYLLPECR